MDAWDRLWQETRPAFAQERTWERARRLALSALLCLGRHTVTGLLTTAGRQFTDWSADFRLFERGRFNPDALFRVVRQAVQSQENPTAPFVVAMDDTLLRKRGRKIDGTAWRHDPLGPAFYDNFIWALRFLQFSVLVSEHSGPSRARAIPIDLQHCPSPQRPRPNASKEIQEAYRQEQQRCNLSQQGAQRIHYLREELDHDPSGKDRPLILCVDGSFTNKTILQHLPQRTVLIGRIRKDAKLYALPHNSPDAPGRKRSYGNRLPTPEALRQDESIPWQSVSAFAAGKIHSFQIKTLPAVRWRPAGGQQTLRLLVIRPLHYRLSRNSPFLYHNPSYLLCTDPNLPLDQFLQHYLHRWEIELNFRDEKTLLGMEQPQVRIPQAVASAPAFFTAAYAFLLLAAHHTDGIPQRLQSLTPKWRPQQPNHRPSTAELISLLRQELWGLAIQTNHFSGFANPSPPTTKPQNLHRLLYSLHSACFYAQK